MTDYYILIRIKIHIKFISSYCVCIYVLLHKIRVKFTPLNNNPIEHLKKNLIEISFFFGVIDRSTQLLRPCSQGSTGKIEEIEIFIFKAKRYLIPTAESPLYFYVAYFAHPLFLIYIVLYFNPIIKYVQITRPSTISMV